MDSLTHIAIGACLGEAFAGKTVGKKAMLWGIAAHSIPDIDIIAAFWLSNTQDLLGHRGFTHSILFVLLFSPVFAYFAHKWHEPHKISFTKWTAFFLVAIGGHIFIDAFNNYGTAWFEPFSHYRVTFNTVYVADPLFSIWSIIALTALIITKRGNKIRQKFWKFGLGFTALYLFYCTINKIIIDQSFKRELKINNVVSTKYFTTPAPLQNWLWFVVAGNDKGFYVGYKSVFHPSKNDGLTFFPKNDSLLDNYKDDEDIKNLKRFSNGFYTASYYTDTLVFNDLRFGQEAGWLHPHGKFAFHYYLMEGADNSLVVQRGRFANWDWDATKAFWRKIKGK